ncbi:hypothetical protein [Pararhizobium gei]|uniref:hypothetical protein n=1 Tax=Pararhizobium gei TaxID=1395951 RepID=UPI0023DA3305|nr:hypothetical protein [Rhizobium gei]
MGKASNERYKARKKKEAAARLNYDNARPNQMSALDAEREKLMASALKRLSPAQRKLLDKGSR